MYHEVRTTARKIGRRLALVEGLVYRRRAPLPAFRYYELTGPQDGPLAAPEIDDSQWAVVEGDSYWSGHSTDFVLRTRFEVPPDWEPDAQVALYLPLSERGEYCRPETLAYLDGRSYTGIDGNHQEVLLTPDLRDGRSHLLALRGWTGRPRDAEPEPGKRPYLHACWIVQIDQPTRDFIAAVRVALGVANALDNDAPARAYVLDALDAAFNCLDLSEPLGDDFYASLPEAHAVLQQGVAAAGQPLDVEIVATGHSHLDVAWLWTLGQTRRKAGRTYHSTMRLMEQFPDYHFTQSQPQLYDYIRQDYPELFAAIQDQVAEGRWEPIGGMWVEADTNISGPESLARQFLLGRSFFREHFGTGAESPVLWLPDVFGYAWQLPQLARQAGLEYFFTVKLSWNRYNRIPYDSFWWQGLDGSKLLTHFSATPDYPGATSSTYNAMATPDQTIGTWQNYQQKELHGPLLMTYGYGDGGGGPTREMLENIRLMENYPGTPRLCQGSVRDFFQELAGREGSRLPVWNGELYFELHRGTYTTQGRNKRANRRSEFLLHDAEFLAAWAAQRDPTYAYPHAALRRAWQLVCLNQFHDIIPGSSIGAVYAESLAQYDEVAALAEQVCDGAVAALANLGAAGGQGLSAELDSSGTEGRLLMANPTSFTRHDLAFWPGRLAEGEAVCRPDGTRVPAQSAPDGTWLATGELPPYGMTALRIAREDEPDEVAGAVAPRTAPGIEQDVCAQVGPKGATLENAHLRVEFNKAGDITRIFDKFQSREVLASGAVANEFQAFEDRPTDWDAWDLDIFYEAKQYLAEPASAMVVVENGPLRATLAIRRRILHSEYTQRISLDSTGPRLDCSTVIDWRERHTLLKVAFPVDVFSPVATYEIQWGQIQRPTHRNTSWDWARFETCAQKWADLSEGDYGVSLLNDGKYGYDIQGHVLRLSLLRSPTMPDPEADQGEHSFTYSLLPHEGGVGEATMAAAYCLNDPILLYATGPEDSEIVQGGATSFLSTDAPNVIVETIKQAEDGAGLIVRLYESQRRRGPVTLTAALPLAGAWRTDLLETNQEGLEIAGNQARFYIKPFEIVTLRLMPAA
jgi:alpha-mannosidase